MATGDTGGVTGKPIADPTAPKSYGPHLFDREKGPEELRIYLLYKLPVIWKKVFDAPMVDKEGYMLWAPGKQKCMRWSRDKESKNPAKAAQGTMVDKLVSYYFSVDPKLKKATKDKFAAAFFDRFLAELKPKPTTNPQLFLEKLYHYANLAPEGVFTM